MARHPTSFLRKTACFCAFLALSSACGTAAVAGSEMRAGGKLLLTNGVSTVDGSAGGGLASWALIAGNETRDGVGGSAHLTYVPLKDFSLVSAGVAIGLFDKIEFSYARESFDTRKVGATLGLGRGFHFHENVFGVKAKLIGDAVYGPMPQIAVGLQYKQADRGAIIRLIGGAHDTGTDFTLSATKIVLSESLVLSGTLRMTKANQFGLLGFGGDRGDHYSAQFEGSAGYMISRKFVVGGELRTKPSTLSFAHESDSYDVFVAYALHPNVSLTAAYVDLGSIATVTNQRGAFLSLQASF